MLVDKVLNILKNKYVIGAIVIVVLLLIYNRYKHVIKSKFKPIVGDFTDDVTDVRKSELTEKAKVIHEHIYGLVSNDVLDDDFTYLLALNDSEFYEIYKYYKKYFGSLYDDIDWEFMPFSDKDDAVLSRILGMGLS